MGKKTLLFSNVICGITIVVQMVALVFPMHRVSFFMGFGPWKFARAFTLKTWALSAKLDFNKNDFCSTARSIFGEDAICKDDSAESTDLLDVKERFCAGGISTIMPEACVGLDWAYILGLALTVTCVLNMFLLGVSIFLTYHYVHVSPKKKYREVALILSIVGVVLITVQLMMYGTLVLLKLSTVQVRGGLSVTIEPSKTTGTDKGYVFAWVSVILQIIVCILIFFGKTPEERHLKEAREQMKFEAEMAACQNVAGLAGFGTELPPGQAFAQSPDMYSQGFVGSVGGQPMLGQMGGGQMGGGQMGGGQMGSQWGGQPQFQPPQSGGGWGGPQAYQPSAPPFQQYQSSSPFQSSVPQHGMQPYF
eukprot:TRINITY_DN111909_c0_g1_i1.p1 TRINITY_DN111909_c0_g1~~TRINITY_DN111909_c0_g1_i1.p1  ORF type:complete len:363 (-),score=54.63 TRINITY_DN111909_c0_g1_i1:363-1451(-)